jgi:LEA14-like dessication related protein
MSGKKIRGMSRRGLIVVIAIMLIAAVVAFPKRPKVEFHSVDNWDADIKIEGFSIEISRINMTIILDIYNYNVYGSTLKDVTVKVYLNGVYLGDAESHAHQHIRALGSSLISVQFEATHLPDVSWKNADWYWDVATKDREIRIKGPATVETFGRDFVLELDEIYIVEKG